MSSYQKAGQKANEVVELKRKVCIRKVIIAYKKENLIWSQPGGPKKPALARYFIKCSRIVLTFCL